MSTSQALAAAKAGGLAALTPTNNAFTQYAKREGVTDGFWLRMNGKTGKWLCNLPNQDELPGGTELVFNIWNSEVIWQGFDKDNKLHTGPKVKILSGEALPAHPGTPGVTWKENIRVMVSTTDGGKQMALICKADNAYRPIKKLVKRYGELFTRMADAGSSTGYRMPVVKISSEAYDMKVKVPVKQVNPATGKEEFVEQEQKITNFREVFKISDDPQDWITEAEMNAIAEAAGEEAAAAAAAETVVAADGQKESVAAIAEKDSPPWVDDSKGPVEEAQVVEATAQAPAAGSDGGFRRLRAGQTGVRTG